MKDFFEPFLYPHNLTLVGLMLACFCYRKKGLFVCFWCLISKVTQEAVGFLVIILL